jgi:hypothetical protein
MPSDRLADVGRSYARGYVDDCLVLSAWLPGLGAYLPACARISVTMVVPASALRQP